MPCTDVLDPLLRSFGDLALSLVVLALYPDRIVIQQLYDMIEPPGHLNNPPLHLIIFLTLRHFDFAERECMPCVQHYNRDIGRACSIHDMALDRVAECQLVIAVVTYPEYLFVGCDEQCVVLACDYLVD